MSNDIIEYIDGSPCWQMMFNMAIEAARNPNFFTNEKARAEFIIEMLEYGKRLDKRHGPQSKNKEQ